VLSLGLSFVPPPVVQDLRSTICRSLDEYIRQIRIKKYFARLNELNSSNNATTTFNMILKKKKILTSDNFSPPLAGFLLENYFSKITKKINNCLNRCHAPRYRSIPEQFMTTLVHIKTRDDIIVKPADKGLGITVMDRHWYHSEALRQLNDSSTYSALVTPPTVETLRNELIYILNKHGVYRCKNNNVTPIAKNMLLNLASDQQLQLGRIYFLPKLHKSPVVGRPIVSSIGTATYTVSVYLSICLKDILIHIQSYVRDSQEVLLHLERNSFPLNCWLLTADVDSLYPSIDINDGLNSLNIALRLTKFPSDRATLILDLTKWVLENNYIEFGQLAYKQIKGTAMGSPVSVAFACIHLAIIENEVFQSLTTQQLPLPLLYLRYIDDILAVWPSEQACLHFVELFNSRRPGIRVVKPIISYTEVIFLDIHIKKGSRFPRTGHLDTCIYQKESNKFLFIPPFSWHHPSSFKGWITGYIKRIRLNCTNDAEFHAYKRLFYSHLLQRGYEPSYLQPLFLLAYNRQYLLQQVVLNHRKLQNASTPLLFKLQYNECTKWLAPTLRKLLTVPESVKNDPDYQQIFNNKNGPLFCFQRGKCLSEYIVRSKY